MKAFGYCRVSTTRQRDKGESLETQAETIAAWCKTRGHTLVDVFYDSASGRTREERPSLEASVKAASEAKGVLVVYDISRLARRLRDSLAILEDLAASGAQIASVRQDWCDTTSPAGKFVFTVIGGIAEMFSAELGERVKAANERTVRNKGYRTQGQQPYGYRLENKVRVPVPEELAIVAQFRRWRKQGATYEKVAALANEAGYRKRRGKPWDAASIFTIMGRKVKV